MMRPSTYVRAAVPLLLAFSFYSCTDSGGPAGPGASPAFLSLGAVFAEVSAEDALPVNLVRAWAVSPDRSEVLSDPPVEERVDPDAETWVVDLEVEVNGPTDLVVVFELVNVENGTETVVYAGETETIEVSPGERTEVSEDQVDVVRGPLDNLDVTALEIVTAPPVVLETETVELEADVEGGENPVVFWQLAEADRDRGIATVERTGATSAVVTGIETGTVTVVAEAGAERDEIQVRVTAPALLEPVTSTETETRGGTSVAEAPTVQVLDVLGEVVPGAEVTFTTGDFGGLNGDRATIGGSDALTVVTDEEGFAVLSQDWTIGIRSGTYTLTVSVEGAEPVTFTATALPTLRGAHHVEAGRSHTCALNGAGEAFCWGANQHGQVGNTALGLDVAVSAPVPVEGENLFTTIVISNDFNCGLTADHDVLCWGFVPFVEPFPELPEPVRTPTAIAAFQGPRFEQFEIGLGGHACGVTTDGEALCIGENDWGQLGIGEAGGVHEQFVSVVGDIQFVEIYPSFLNTCGLSSEGVVYCWGVDLWGALGDGAPENNAIAGPQPIESDLNGSFTDLDVGTAFYCATTADGDAHCWGNNLSAQTGVGADPGELSRVLLPTAVAGSTPLFGLSLPVENSTLLHACGLDAQETGSVLCWGFNDSGQVGAATSDICLLGETLFDCAWEPVVVGGGLTASDLASGFAHTCAATPDGELRCWGRNTVGQLGDESTVDSTDPVPVAEVVLNPTEAIISVQQPAMMESDHPVTESIRWR